MQTVQSIGVRSCARIFGAIYGCLALFVAPVMLLIGLTSAVFGAENERFSGIAMAAFAIFAPVFYGVIGAISGALFAWIYNLVAKRFGGVQVELKPTIANRDSTENSIGLI